MVDACFLTVTCQILAQSMSDPKPGVPFLYGIAALGQQHGVMAMVLSLKPS